MSKFFAIAWLFLASFGANAQGTNHASFCDQPVAAICGENNSKAMARATRLERTLRYADHLALRDVKHKFPSLNRRGLTKEDLNKISNHALREKVLTFFYQSQLEKVSIHLGNTPKIAQLHFDRIKSRLEKVIRANSKISKTESDDMLARLKNSEIVDAVEVLRGKKGSQILRDAVIESCNRDGLQENAFADEIENKNYVIVCPGDYLGGMDRNERGLAPSELLLANEVWTLGHETGHHVDSGEHPLMFSKMQDCLAKNYSHEFKEPVANYMSEISADHWGNEELASYLVRFPTPEAKFAALRRSMISLCGSEDDGVHPAGNFRIEMLRRNPRIHKIMQCKSPATNLATDADASCTLRGQWPQIFWASGAKNILSVEHQSSETAR